MKLRISVNTLAELDVALSRIRELKENLRCDVRVTLVPTEGAKPMAKVKIEGIIEHLKSDMRKAMQVAVETQNSDIDLDYNQLFKDFRRAVGRKCSTWETVPDRLIDMEQ